MENKNTRGIKKIIVGITIMFFSLFFSLLVDSNRIGAAGVHQLSECKDGDDRPLVEGYCSGSFVSIKIPYSSYKTEDTMKILNPKNGAIGEVFFLSDRTFTVDGNIEVYIKKKAFLGAPRHVALFKEGKEVYNWSDNVRIYSNSKEINETINFNDSDLGNGVYYLIYINEDANNKVMYKLSVDLTPPTVSFSSNSNSTYKQSHSVTVTVNDNIGVDHNYLRYAWSTSTAFPTSVTSSSLTKNSDTKGTKTITTPSGATGKYYLHIEVKDTAANKTRSSTGVFYLDNDKPTIRSLSLRDAQTGMNYSQGTWTNHNVEVEFYCSDSTSGMKKCDLYNGSTLLKSTTSGGIHFLESDINSSSIRIRMEDNAGNVSYSSFMTIRIDKTGPTVSFSPHYNTTYKKSHSVTVTVNDNIGVDRYSLRYAWTTTTTFPQNTTSSSLVNNSSTKGTKTITTPSGVSGRYYLHIEARDSTGNIKRERTGVFYLDNEDPTIAFLSTSDSVYRKAKTVTIIANDTISSLDHYSLKYKWSTSSTFSSTGMTYSALTQISDTLGERSVTSPSGSNGVYYLHVQIKDKAGNIKNEVTGPFLLDNTAPTPGEVTFRDLNGGTFDPNQINAWSKVDITVDMKAASDNSGRLQTDKIIVEMTNKYGTKYWWDHTPGELLLLQSSGFYKLTHIVIDEAGNKATEKVYNFTIDKIGLESNRVKLEYGTEEKILEDGETYYTNQNVGLSPNKDSSELSGLGTVKVYFDIYGCWMESDGYIACINIYNSYNHGLQSVGVSEEGRYKIVIITTNDRDRHELTHYLVIDKTPPNNSTLSFTEENNDIYDAGVDATWTSSSVLVSVANVGVDDGSDPAAISGETTASYTDKYLDNNCNWQIYENIINNTLDTILSMTNYYLIEVYTTDRAGNVSTRTYRVRIDKENPVGDMLFSRTDNTPVDLTTSAWINHDLNLNIEKMQTKYIEEPTEYSFNIKRDSIEIANSVIGYTLREDGQYEIVLNMNKPQSGNSVTKTYTFYIDKTNPSYAGEIKLMRESGDEIEDGSWVNIEDGLRAAINKNGEDAMAVDKTVLSYYNAVLEKYTEYNGEVFNTSGRYTFKITTYDKAGNFTTGEKTVTLFNSNELGLDDVLIEFNYDKDSKTGLYNGFTYIDGNGEYNYKTGDNNPIHLQ